MNDVVLEEARPVVLLHSVVEISQLVRCWKTYTESLIWDISAWIQDFISSLGLTSQIGVDSIIWEFIQ